MSEKIQAFDFLNVEQQFHAVHVMKFYFQNKLMCFVSCNGIVEILTITKIRAHSQEYI